MHLVRVSERTDELASAVGPLETMVALARLEDALAELDSVAGEEVIDLREAEAVLSRTGPVVARAEQRVEQLAGLLRGH
ncbi:MAG: hypothetical protein R2716_04170 [Microthrixaceae bacterium]